MAFPDPDYETDVGLVTVYNERILVSAAVFEGGLSRLVSIVHEGESGDSCLFNLSVRDAHALCVALYRVIADCDQEAVH